VTKCTFYKSNFGHFLRYTGTTSLRGTFVVRTVKKKECGSLEPKALCRWIYRNQNHKIEKFRNIENKVRAFMNIFLNFEDGF
jgi:hypothetical protein